MTPSPPTSVQVAKVILLMMAKKVEDRPQSADEVIKALDAFLKEEGSEHLKEVQQILGAGFRLAIKDLEIRGTGNMLGPEQSGHIHAVGFDMYIEMLESAVAELRGVKAEEEIETRISLRVSAFIPEEFIEDIALRLSIYRKIALSGSDEDLNALMDELRDRFGRLPVEVQNLFDIMRLKILAKKLLITDIEESAGNIRVIFSKNTKVAVEKVLELGDIMKGRIKFLQEGFEIKGRNLAWDETFKLIKEVLKKL